jgi:hypothetical protein
VDSPDETRTAVVDLITDSIRRDRHRGGRVIATKSVNEGVKTTRAEIEETLGVVPGFWGLNDEDLVNE